MFILLIMVVKGCDNLLRACKKVRGSLSTKSVAGRRRKRTFPFLERVFHVDDGMKHSRIHHTMHDAPRVNLPLFGKVICLCSQLRMASSTSLASNA